ncbi:hypothetical protein BH09VER1_BH09VER1_22190 [soil metagenome]
MLSMVTWAVAAAGFEKDFKCPICGADFKQEFEGSGTTFGTRLDFKPLGPTPAPWAIPSCPKCGYVFYQVTPDKESIKRLKAFIASPAFKAKKDYPNYYRLAMIRDFFGTEKLAVGDAYIQASWQVESQPAINKECLQLAYQAFSLGLKALPPDHPHYADTSLICGELERRLGLFDAASARFNEVKSSAAVAGNPKVKKIIARQLEFISRKDSAPHAVDENLEILVNGKKP